MLVRRCPIQQQRLDAEKLTGYRDIKEDGQCALYRFGRGRGVRLIMQSTTYNLDKIVSGGYAKLNITVPLLPRPLDCLLVCNCENYLRPFLLAA
jgi:hypothetical protein